MKNALDQEYNLKALNNVATKWLLYVKVKVQRKHIIECDENKTCHKLLNNFDTLVVKQSYPITYGRRTDLKGNI